MDLPREGNATWCSFTPRSERQFTVNFSIWLFAAFFATSCVLSFAAAKYYYKLDWLRLRGITPILGSFVAVQCVFMASLKFAVSLPCSFLIVVILLIEPLIFVSIIVRVLLISLMNRYAILMQVSMNDADDDEDDVPDGGGLGLRFAFMATLSSIYSLGCSSEENLFRFSRARRKDTLKSLKFLRSFWGHFLLFLVLFLPFLIFVIILTAIAGNVNECIVCTKMLEVSSIFVIASAFPICLILVFVLFRIRNLVDPWGLKREVLLITLTASLMLALFVLDSFITLPSDSIYNNSILVTFSGVLMTFVQTLWPVIVGYLIKGEQDHRVRQPVLKAYRSRASAHSVPSSFKGMPGVAEPKLQSDDLLHPSLFAGSILANANFESYLATELNLEYLMFIKDCGKWKDLYIHIPEEASVARARRIYNQYVDPWGIYAIEFSSNIISNMANKLGRSLKRTNRVQCVGVDVFDEAVQFVKNLIESGAWSRFLTKPHADSLKVSDQRDSRDEVRVSSHDSKVQLPSIVQSTLETCQKKTSFEEIAIS